MFGDPKISAHPDVNKARNWLRRLDSVPGTRRMSEALAVQTKGLASHTLSHKLPLSTPIEKFP